MHVTAEDEPRSRLGGGSPEPLALFLGDGHRHSDVPHQVSERAGRSPLELRWVEWKVVDEKQKRSAAVKAIEPCQLLLAHATDGVPDRQGLAADRERAPEDRNRVDDRDPPAAREWLDERGHGRDPGAPFLDDLVEPPPAGRDQRRRIPEAQDEAPQIRRPARVTAARGQIVVAVEDCQAIRVEQIPGDDGVERTFEQGWVPAVEQISSDNEMRGLPRGDAIELVFQRGHIAVIPQVEIRQVRNEHTSSRRVEHRML